ncbi:MAG: cytochrome d ubiquinol oxidase subunit II [Methylobacter sp.]|nr:cytochrome d ubiquinol oxidase subunit II [Methylobacter sp.]
MQDLQLFLATIWFFLLGLVLVLYVVLDGFDLGVGMLSLFARNERSRGIMMASLGHIWDANETWLVILGGVLFGAFPLAYGVILQALYLPLLLMIFGLIFRGMAFGFRENADNKAPWNVAFGLGSLLSTLAQGLILGGFIGGIPMHGRSYTGQVWDWLTPFSLLVATGAVFGYALLGATYLIIKTEGDIQLRNYRYARIAASLMLIAATGISIWTPLRHAYVAARWFVWPNFFYIALLPAGAFFCFLMLMRSLQKRRERAPFFWSLGIFLFSFIGLAVSLYPYIIPTTITLTEAAASPKTLVFMLTGIGMLIPLMLGYNAYQYAVFRGKVREEEGYHSGS